MGGLPPPNVPRETADRLEAFEALVRDESQRQNLVAASTLDNFWNRHILDSLQLVPLAPTRPRRWLDVGSGAGFPGLVVAIATGDPMILTEPRARRADFLARVAEELTLDSVTVVRSMARHVLGQVDVITARAVASLEILLAETVHLAHGDTRWLLLKGRRWRDELAEARESWQGRFEAVPSVTSGEAAVIIGSRIGRVAGR